MIYAEPDLIDGIDKTLATFAVVTAFAATPLIRYANPADFLTLGCWLAVGFGLTFTTRHLPGRWRLIGAIPGFLALGLTAALAVPLLRDARSASVANDRRCLAVQRDMLSASPQRGDATDLFQALGCRPQGEGSVYAAARRGPAR